MLYNYIMLITIVTIFYKDIFTYFINENALNINQ